MFQKKNEWSLEAYRFKSLVSIKVFFLKYYNHNEQGWISDMGIDGPTFVPKSGYFLPILVKVCPQKLAFS